MTFRLTITDGPSKKGLQVSLFERRFVSFKDENNQTYFAVIGGCTIEADGWRITGALELPAFGKNRMSHLPKSFSGFFRSTNRTGWLLVE